MFLGGLAHGLWPGLTPGDSLRSLVGSVAPFVFGFSRLSRGWAQAIIRTTAGRPCSRGRRRGLRPRRHPPPVRQQRRLAPDRAGPSRLPRRRCETAVYACLLELYRHGRRADLLLLGANLLLLLLTGARAPLTLALAVVGLSLLLVRSTAFPARHRLLLILSARRRLAAGRHHWCSDCCRPDLSAVRAFQVLTTNLGNLSGRQLLWPNFAQAAAGSPWVGWGVGAGNVIIPHDDPVARLLQTWAAHNEYLRVEVEGGQLGRALLVVLMFLWVRQHTAPLLSVGPRHHAAGVRRFRGARLHRQRADLHPCLRLVHLRHGGVRAWEVGVMIGKDMSLPPAGDCPQANRRRARKGGGPDPYVAKTREVPRRQRTSIPVGWLNPSCLARRKAASVSPGATADP